MDALKGAVSVLISLLFVLLVACSGESAPTETSIQATKGTDEVVSSVATPGDSSPATQTSTAAQAESTEQTQGQTAPSEASRPATESTTDPTSPTVATEATQPVEPTQSQPTEGTEPTETTVQTEPTEDTYAPPETYGDYLAMSGDEQSRFIASFEDPMDFFAWIKAAKEAYEATGEDIYIDGDTTIDLEKENT